MNDLACRYGGKLEKRASRKEFWLYIAFFSGLFFVLFLHPSIPKYLLGYFRYCLKTAPQNLGGVFLLSFFLIAGLAPYAVKKQNYNSAKEYLIQKISLIIQLSIFGFIITKTYFGIKGIPWLWDQPFKISVLEYGLWSKIIIPTTLNLPAWVIDSLFFLYSKVWPISLFSFVLIIILGSRGTSIRFYVINGIIMLCFAYINLLIPTSDPLREMPYLFSDHIISKIHANEYLHQAYATTTFAIQKYGSNIFDMVKGQFLPIAGLPSYHIGFIYFIKLFYDDFYTKPNKAIVLILEFYIFLLWLGSILLGYHFIIDGFLGILIVKLIYVFFKDQAKTTRKTTRDIKAAKYLDFDHEKEKKWIRKNPY